MRITTKRAIILIITSAWLAGMYFLVQREYFPTSGKYLTANYQNTLPQIKQEKYGRMAIYYGSHRQKIGEIQTMIVPSSDGTFEISTRTKFSVELQDPLMATQIKKIMGVEDLQGQKLEAGMQTVARIGPDYQIKDIAFQIHSNFLDLSYRGQIKGNKLSLTVQQKGREETQEISLPQGTMLSDNIGMVGQFPKLEVGKQIRMKCYDPMTRGYQVATSQVMRKENFSWEGQVIPVYLVHTSMGPFKSSAWVAEDGEVMQYQMLSFTFIKQSVKKIEEK